MRKLKTIILHMGPDKTGSTAIQRTLEANTALLASKGVLYSTGIGHNDKILSASFCQTRGKAEKFFGSGDAGWEARAQACREHLRTRALGNTATTLILSHEGLVHLNVKEMTALRDLLHEIAESIVVVLYARAPESYAVSAMCQRVKMGRRAWKVKPPLQNVMGHAQQAIAIFGRQQVKMRCFDSKVFPGGDVVMDFLSMPELAPLNQLTAGELNRPFAGNPSFSHDGLHVGDTIVEIMGKKAPKNKRFKNAFADALYGIDGGRARLSKWQLWAIRLLSAVQINYIKREFGIVFAPRAGGNLVADKGRSCWQIEQLARQAIAARFSDFHLSRWRSLWRQMTCHIADCIGRK